MVREYQKPEFKTVVFASEDVITTSNSELTSDFWRDDVGEV